MKFAQLSQAEVNLLMKHKIGRTGWAVYCCLAAHAQNKDHAFPKIETISEWLGGQRSRKVIEKALKQLCDCGIVFRNHRSSKKRFVLAARKRVPKLTEDNSSPAKLEGLRNLMPAKLEVVNPAKLEVDNPAKFEPIIEKGKDKENISISNEVNPEEVTDEMMIEEMRRNWLFKATAITETYDWFYEKTGEIVSEENRRDIKRIMQKDYPEEHKKLLIEKILSSGIFRK
jgi:hypothetical protein